MKSVPPRVSGWAVFPFPIVDFRFAIGLLRKSQSAIGNPHLAIVEPTRYRSRTDFIATRSSQPVACF